MVGGGKHVALADELGVFMAVEAEREDVAVFENLQVRGEVRDRVRTFLPDPKQEEIKYNVISVDDHVLEPPSLFEGRLPKQFADRAPRIVRGTPRGDFWRIEDVEEGMGDWNGASGRPMNEWSTEPLQFDEIRRGVWDPKERLRDMDLAGIVASVCFPSGIWGFAGQKFMRMKDRELGLACLRAYNDWVVEEWSAVNPSRLIAFQIPWYHDMDIAAQEIERNAARGVKCVSFSENPEKIGMPSLYTNYWDPFFRACEETGTVINLHVGSSSQISKPSKDSPEEASLALFGANSMLASIDWLYAQIPVRFPKLKIVYSESGIGFLPMLIDRLEHIQMYRDYELLKFSWTDLEMAPVDVFRRNFWFSTFWDPIAFGVIDKIGANRVLLEVDYPHPDSIWPDVQGRCDRQLAGLDKRVVDAVTYGNAAELFSIPISSINGGK